MPIVKRFTSALFVGTILAAIFMTFSCNTLPRELVWDEEIPREESARIVFQDFRPVAYNGVDVKDLANVAYTATGVYAAWGKAVFPAGNAEFSGHLRWVGGSSQDFYKSTRRSTHSFRQDDVTFSCKLEAGKIYMAWAGYAEDGDNLLWGVYFYGAEDTGAVEKKDYQLVAFIPVEPMTFSEKPW